MGDQEQALLAAVVARPDDDLPRLVYADWLEEHGEPERAEFIHVQCELAGLAPRTDHGTKLIDICVCPDCQRRNALRRRERELLADYAAPWFTSGPLTCVQHLLGDTRGCDARCVRGTPRRGFISDLTLPWDAWHAHAAALLAACPIARAKDGVVRLATGPEVGYEYDSAGRRQEARMWAGDELARARIETVGGRHQSDAILACLAVAYPGVRFELPPLVELVGQSLEWDHDTATVTRVFRRADGTCFTTVTPAPASLPADTRPEDGPGM